ncbi:hypothetical protein BCR34DRAFT_598383 [Clohesyomyces aquaticus]|uniref:Tachykinin family protein n=1 Tax=Clohesyomyces aquaticus TaxID=1231657 RepID=A0A1Y1ZYV6_9PLEO|nr:hypothetical protein BCR34DRAFT_598383 [Clohesyomyces aquaticus]
MPLDLDPDESLGEIPRASASRAPSQPRVRRRARKRNGPPEFQFLTATDPSQFKDEHAKRSVRSQAMIQYRYRAEQQRQKGQEVPEASSGGSVKPQRTRRITASTTNEPPPWQSRPNRLIERMMNVGEGEDPLFPPMTSTFPVINVDEGFGEPAETTVNEAPLPLVHSARYRRILSMPSLTANKQKITEYEETDEHETIVTRILCGKLGSLQNLGDGVDPFSVIPQFENPELDSLFLVRTCNRAFVSTATTIKWMPILLANPKALLSSTALASTYNDMRTGCQGDSKRTMLVKSEIIGYINDFLRDTELQFSDMTLLLILHLLAGEMWNCNEKILRIHESGITRLIRQRGGIKSLGGNGAIAEVAAACCYHIDIFCEATPNTIFEDWNPPSFAPVEDIVAIPESPIFSPRSEFYTIAHSGNCSETTYELLCDMRDLTDLFLSHHAGFEKKIDIPLTEDELRKSPSEEYDSKVAAISARLSALPSAYTPNTPVSNDWIYESCRIAAIIYTTAIMCRISFSDASGPGRSPLIPAAASQKHPAGQGDLQYRRLSDALFQAVEKSNMTDVWGGMSGVLYWVAMIGAAAARIPSTTDLSQQQFGDNIYAMWVRRCFIMFATRTMIVLIFGHPVPILVAQRKLLRVQELTGRGHHG